MTTKQTALITGASSGIGLEMTKYFARDGYNLVLVARSEQSMKELAHNLNREYNISVTVIAKDLSQPSAPEELFAEVQAAGIHIDVLVNNAGYGNFGLFHETDLQKELDMLQLNIVALTHLTKLFVRGMVGKRKGRVLNVASTAAFQPGPLMAVYYASKAYVLSFSEALANELKEFGVNVTALCPGPTISGFQKTADMEKSKLVKNKSAMMDSDTVARIGYAALMQGKPVVIPGAMNRAMAMSPRFVPRGTVTKIVRRIQEASH